MLTPAQFRAKTWSDPEWFLGKVLGGKFWQKTVDLILAVRDNRRVSCSGCTGSSKTYSSAMLCAWWLFAQRDSRVITLAPGFRQVGMNLWGYIHKVVNNARVPLGGNLLGTTWRLSKDHYAIGFSADDPNNVHGIHGPNDLLVLDDAHGIQQPLCDALENTMAGGKARLLLLFNKNCTSGEAYNSYHTRRHLYKTIGISAYETPNVKAALPHWLEFKAQNQGISHRELIQRFAQEVEPKTIVIDGMICLSQVLEWEDSYGLDSDRVRVYVRDEFPKEGPNVVIPNEWIELAMQREVRPEGRMVLGVDVGRSVDRVVIFPVKGRQAFTPRIFYGFNRTTQTTGEVIRAEDELGSSCSFVDVIGVGGGVVDELYEARRQVIGVNVAIPSTVLKDSRYPEKGFKFSNIRAEVWWTIRDALDPQNPNCIALPKSDGLRSELSSVEYWHNSKGEIVIESKDEMKVKLNGKSPDEADGLGLALYGQKHFKDLANTRLVSVMTMGDEYDD